MEETLFGAPDPADRVIEALWQVKGWPKDYEKDREFVARIRKQFPRMTPDQLEVAVNEWAIWLLSHPEVYKGNRNWTSRFLNWLKGGERIEFRRRERRGAGSGGRVGGTGSGKGPASTRAGTAAEFGETRRLDDW